MASGNTIAWTYPYLKNQQMCSNNHADVNKTVDIINIDWLAPKPSTKHVMGSDNIDCLDTKLSPEEKKGMR